MSGSNLLRLLATTAFVLVAAPALAQLQPRSEAPLPGASALGAMMGSQNDAAPAAQPAAPPANMPAAGLAVPPPPMNAQPTQAPAPKPVLPVGAAVQPQQPPASFVIPPAAAPLPRMPAPQQETLDEINRLNSEIAVKTLKLRDAQLDQEIRKANETTAPTRAGESSRAGDTAAPAEDTLLPVVSRITGSNGRLKAHLLMPGGGSAVVGKGDRIGSGLRVIEVTPNAVSVASDSGKHQTLAFGTQAPRPQTRQVNGMTPIMPMQIQ